MAKTSFMYKCIKGLVALCYPKTALIGQLPEGAAIIVGNHTKMNGPICSELFIPQPRYTWCNGEMMDKKEVAAYAYQDFWSQKPKAQRPFYKLLSHLIVPFSVCVFNNADTIGVYRDARIMSTFKTTLKHLQEGCRIVIFPEHYEPHNHIVNDFQDKFIDIARLYYKKTGQKLPFVPLYIAPALKQMHLGQPVYYDPDAPAEQERMRIKNALMDSVTELALSLPPHRVVPYNNVPKKQHPISREEAQ